MGHCKDCEYWYNDGLSDDMHCGAIENGCDMARAIYDGYEADVIVAPDFGCVLFEAKEENGGTTG